MLTTPGKKGGCCIVITIAWRRGLLIRLTQQKIFGKNLDPQNVQTPRSKYFEIVGRPLKYLDRVRSACCSRIVNCTKNGRTRFVRSWDDTLLTRCHEPGL